MKDHEMEIIVVIRFLLRNCDVNSTTICSTNESMHPFVLLYDEHTVFAPYLQLFFLRSSITGFMPAFYFPYHKYINQYSPKTAATQKQQSSLKLQDWTFTDE